MRYIQDVYARKILMYIMVNEMEEANSLLAIQDTELKISFLVNIVLKCNRTVRY